MDHAYPPAIDPLLALGEAHFGETWPDYLALGLGPEQTADLIRLATDRAIYAIDGTPVEGQEPVERPEIWAPIHARRALGQLRAVSAAEPLLAAMAEFMDLDDYWVDEMPRILATIGPFAIPAVTQALADASRDEFVRITASSALAEIGQAHPESRDECVGLLVDQLARHEPEADALNGFLVSALVELKAVEAAPAIEAAFAADRVDPTIAGDWPMIRFRLGLGPEPPRRRPLLGYAPDPAPRRPDLKKIAKKRKAQKQARKRGRKRR